MEIIKKDKNGVQLVSFIGRLDAGSSSSADLELKDIIKKDSKLIIDLNRLEYISSAGLRVLLVAAKAIHNKSGMMCLFGLNDNVSEVFNVSGFSAIFDIAESEEEATKIVKDI